MRILLFAALLAALAAPAAAQGVYRYSDKDGRVIYTDDPKAGGGTAHPVEDRTSTVASPDPAANRTSKKLLEQADRRAAELDRATNDIVVAYNTLRAAEARKDAGVEPVEGERQGRRFRAEYWQRQQGLQGEIDAARARLNEALERRNALR